MLPLYTKPTNLRQIGSTALLCGWGSVSQDDVLDDATGDAKYSQNLHCMNLILLTQPGCWQYFVTGDFERKVICGQAVETHHIITLVIFYFVNKLTFFILSSGFFVTQLA